MESGVNIFQIFRALSSHKEPCWRAEDEFAASAGVDVVDLIKGGTLLCLLFLLGVGESKQERVNQLKHSRERELLKHHQQDLQRSSTHSQILLLQDSVL